MKLLMTGHILLLFCCGFYLAWWCHAFRPGFAGSRVAGPAGALLLITAVTGLAGVVFSAIGNSRPGSRPALIPSSAVIVGGIVLYVLLMIGSSVFLHRRVTTELLLIIAWLVLEIVSYQTAYYNEAIGKMAAAALMAAAVIGSIIIRTIVTFVYFFGIPADATMAFKALIIAVVIVLQAEPVRVWMAKRTERRALAKGGAMK